MARRRKATIFDLKRAPGLSGQELVNLQRGASISPGQAGGLGTGAALQSIMAHSQQNAERLTERRLLLQENLEKGNLGIDDLSKKDAAILDLDPIAGQQLKKLAPLLKEKKEPSGVGGFFSNLLGEKGLSGALLHLPGGLV